MLADTSEEGIISADASTDERRFMKERFSTEILIVGGGIAGVGLAAALKGERKVAILEQERDLAYHSTGRSAAVYVRNYGNGPIRALNAASEPLFREEGERLAHPLLTPRGIVYIADEAKAGAIADLVANSTGAEEISPTRARRMVPILDPAYLHAAAFEADAQDIDVHALHQAWLKKARTQGTVVLQGAALERANHDGGLWTVETAKYRIEANVIVNAAGAWADVVARRCQVKPVGLRPFRRSMAVLPAPQGLDASRWPLVDEVSEQFYFKPDGGRLFVSPCDQDPVEPHDVFADDMVLAEGLYRFEQAVTIPVTRVERTWAGLRTFARDRSPVVGYDPEAESFFWLAGQGGYGIQTSPALSAFAAHLLEKEAPMLEYLVPELSPARFHRK